MTIIPENLTLNLGAYEDQRDLHRDVADALEQLYRTLGADVTPFLHAVDSAVEDLRKWGTDSVGPFEVQDVWNFAAQVITSVTDPSGTHERPLTDLLGDYPESVLEHVALVWTIALTRDYELTSARRLDLLVDALEEHDQEESLPESELVAHVRVHHAAPGRSAVRVEVLRDEEDVLVSIEPVGVEMTAAQCREMVSALNLAADQVEREEA